MKNTLGTIVVLAAIGTLPIYGQCSPSPAAKAYPKVPFQITYEKKVNQLGYTKLLLVPVDRFAIIESVAIKGAQAPKTYLAIEMATAMGALPTQVPVQLPQNSAYVRHFLYSKETDEKVPVYIRETTKVYAGPQTWVAIGLQSSGAQEPMSVTLTGMLVERCSWAP